MKAIRELRDAVAILSTQVQDLQGVINAAGNKKEGTALLNSTNDSGSAAAEGWATVVVENHQRRSGRSGRLDNKNNQNRQG